MGPRATMPFASISEKRSVVRSGPCPAPNGSRTAAHSPCRALPCGGFAAAEAKLLPASPSLSAGTAAGRAWAASQSLCRIVAGPGDGSARPHGYAEGLFTSLWSGGWRGNNPSGA
jgi:hypothetical protein